MMDPEDLESKVEKSKVEELEELESRIADLLDEIDTLLAKFDELKKEVLNGRPTD